MTDVINKILNRKSLMEASRMHSWITGGRSGGKNLGWKISDSFRIPVEDIQ
jgi:hypothetical protein